MNNKRGIFVLLLLVLFLSAFSGMVSAQDDIAGIREGIEGLEEKVDEGKDVVQDVEEKRLEYLGEEWKKVLLKNKYISAVDGFFRNINIVFVVLFGEDYDLSLILFFILVFWVVFLILGYKYVKNIPFLSSWWQYFLVSLAGVIILAQVNLFTYLAEITSKIIFYEKEWYWDLITWIVIIIVISLFYFFNNYFAKHLEELKRKEKAVELERRTKRSEAFIEGVKRGGVD